MYRSFLHNGQVTDRIDTYEDKAVLSADADAALEVAAALGVEVSTITVQHADQSPPVVVTIPPTPAPPPPGPTLEDKVNALLAATPIATQSLGISVST